MRIQVLRRVGGTLSEAAFMSHLPRKLSWVGKLSDNADGVLASEPFPWCAQMTPILCVNLSPRPPICCSWSKLELFGMVKQDLGEIIALQGYVERTLVSAWASPGALAHSNPSNGNVAPLPSSK